MSIDEAIVKLNSLIQLNICPNIFHEIIEWLEELKELRKFKNDFTDLGKLYSEIRLEERNKAIDDFMKEICKIDMETLLFMKLKDISKLLKDGVNNERI